VYCRYITRRSKKNKVYWFCRFGKKVIELNKCSECHDFNFKEFKKANFKSNRLAKLERNRFSVLTDDLEHCYVCGKRKVHIHEVFGGRNRQVSMKNGFCVPVCFECHCKTESDMEFDKGLKRECQMKFEEIHSRSEFLEIIDENYLI